MRVVRITILFSLYFILSFSSLSAQCPVNLDFESGNFTNWRLYTGTCCPISTPTLGAVVTRHTVTSGSGTDAYGGFPVVAPSSGVYSMRLGNDDVNSEAERARYHLRVPAGVNNYSVIFRYAIVLQDPGHVAGDQPRFEVKAYDSATGATVNCSDFTYIASSVLPGFTVSAVATNVYYKSWSTASINLTGSAGRTVILQFSSGDCRQGQHFGYGYVDLNCGLFQIAYNACDTGSTVTLNAPPGFSSYSWRDSATMTSVGTGQTITITRPAVTTTYAVILTPYTGFGCADTLYTRVSVNNLTVNATNDTTICKNTLVQLNAGATATATPLTYSWTPTTNLSCSTCYNPVATIGSNATYKVTVTDAYGCSKSDSLKIKFSNITTSLTPTNTNCFGDSSGSIATTVTLGRSPYTYSWNTTPAKTTASINNLKAGTYILTVSDSIGCSKKDTAVVAQPAQIVANIDTIINVACFNTATGLAVASGSGGTGTYTYSWNTTPAKTTDSAKNIKAGTYIVTVKDSKNCKDTASAVVTQPIILNGFVSAKANVTCSSGNTGWAKASVTGGTAPYTYSWNTTPIQTTDSAIGLAAGSYVVTVTDQNGCTDTGRVTITQPSTINASIASVTHISCNGAATGQARVAVTGGVSPYTYSWNTIPIQTTNIATGLTAGNYIATITDNNGCSDTAGVIITEPTALVATIDSNADVACYGGNNGAARVAVTGGTIPYTYRWSTSPAKTTALATGLIAGSYTVVVTDNKGCKDTTNTLITQPAVLNATATTSAVSCNVGSATATATVTGGNSPYSYSWNTSPIQTTATATGLGFGSYIATVTDSKGCRDTARANITQPPALNATITAKSNISCNAGNNGWALATVSGGGGRYTYSWNTTPAQTTDTAKNLAAGTYIVTIADTLGCSDTAIVTITQPVALAINITATNISCNGGNNGTATAITTGGNTPYTYSWNTTPIQTNTIATSLVAGSYTVTVTDNKGCINTASTTLTQPTAVQATITATTNTSCNPANTGSATVAATGGTYPYTYSWNSAPAQTTASATGLPAGIFTATVTDSKGCTDTARATVGQPTTLVTSIDTLSNVTCHGNNNGMASVSVSGGTTPYTYSWNTTPVRTTTSITGLGGGNYIATVTDALGCSDTVLAVIIEPSVLNASISSSTNLNCNGAATGAATVSVTGGTTPYTYSWNTTPVQTTAIAGSLLAGNYIATVTDNNGCADTAKATITQPAALTVGISGTNISCNGGNNGTSTAIAAGGTAPYTYSWNTTPTQTTATATGLISGSYTVSVTDSKGCVNTASITLTQPTALQATITATTNTSCNPGNTGSATVAATGGTSPYTYSWNTTPVQATASATGLPAGIFTATVTDSKGCRDTAMATVGQPTSLVASIDTFSNITCHGNNNGMAAVKISGGTSPYTYRWNTTPVRTTTMITGLGGGSYTATVTDALGCSDTALVTIIEPATFNANISSSTNLNCNGVATGGATVSVTGGTTPYTYSWNTTPVQTTATASSLLAGRYVVTVTDNSGCTDTAATIITQPTAMRSTVSSTTNNSCFGTTGGSATVVVTGGTPLYTYSWNTTPVQKTATATGLAAGSYRMVAIDSKGCADTANITISQPAILNASISAAIDANCYGSKTAGASVAVSGGTSPYTYRWNTIPAQTTASASGLPAGSYIATVTDSKGCTDTAVATMGQPAPLIATISSFNNINCFGSKTGSAAVAVTGGTTTYSYSWNTNPIQTTATATGMPSGNYNVIVTDIKGCRDTASVSLTQPTKLNASITATNNVKCYGGNDGFATLSTSGGTVPYSYSWNTSPVQTTATANTLPAGTYIAMVTDNNGCTDTAIANITGPAPFIVTAEGLKKTCSEMSEGSATITGITGGTTPYNYNWNSSVPQTTKTAKNLPAGTYTVTVTDAIGCTATGTVTIDNFPKISLGITPDTNMCEGKQVALEATGGNTYKWEPITGLSCSTCYNPIASPDSSMTYTVTVTDSNNCKTNGKVTVSVINKNPVKVGADKNICEGETTQLQASGGTDYTWWPTDGLSDAHTAGPSVKTAKTMKYYVSIVQGTCFTDTLSQTVTIFPNPTVNLGPDQDGQAGSQVQLQAKTTNSSQITWSPPTGLNCTDCANPLATLEKTITYIATVKNELGCTAEDDITIRVTCDESLLFIPNTFTPNGDGSNDRFYPSTKGSQLVKTMKIYNRWGQVLYEAHDFPAGNPNYGWDGTFKDSPLTPDVFVYIIETTCANGQNIFVKGDIALVK